MFEYLDLESIALEYWGGVEHPSCFLPKSRKQITVDIQESSTVAQNQEPSNNKTCLSFVP